MVGTSQTPATDFLLSSERFFFRSGIWLQELETDLLVLLEWLILLKDKYQQ